VGNALDYYPFWAGGREVLIHQQNPYDPQVTLDIQQAIYGRAARPGENQHQYAYPAYAAFAVFPFMVLPFSLSAPLWMAVQQVLLIASIVVVLRSGGGRIGAWQQLLLCLAAMTFRYAMIALVLGQTATWVVFGLSLALWATARGRAGLAGLALAAGFIKPQLVLLPALALLVSLEPGRRLRLILSWGGAMGALFLLSWLFSGFWVDDYLRVLQTYVGYSTTEFPILALSKRWLNPTASWYLNLVATGGLLALYVAVLWRFRASGRLAFPVAMAVGITQLVAPQTGSYNLTLLVLPAAVALQRPGGALAKVPWIGVVGRVVVWASLAIVPWMLFPLVTGPEGIPLDSVVLPVLILLALLGSRSNEDSEPN